MCKLPCYRDMLGQYITNIASKRVMQNEYIFRRPSSPAPEYLIQKLMQIGTLPNNSVLIFTRILSGVRRHFNI